MASRVDERTGVLVVRIWTEEHGDSGLRARIIRTLDISRGAEEEITVAETKAVLAAVGAWLDEFVADIRQSSHPMTRQ